KNNSVAEFYDLGMGMGYVEFLPVEGEKYKANVRFENGEEKSYPLPDAVEESVNIIAHTQDEENLQAAIVTNDKFCEQIKDHPYFLWVQLNGRCASSVRAAIKNISFLINLPKAELANGIVQLSLMQPDGTLVSERLAYLDSQALL